MDFIRATKARIGDLIMDNQISYAPKAREDLLEIKSFIEEESGDIEIS